MSHSSDTGRRAALIVAASSLHSDGCQEKNSVISPAARPASGPCQRGTRSATVPGSEPGATGRAASGATGMLVLTAPPLAPRRAPTVSG